MGGLRGRGAAVTVAAVALILLGGAVALLVMPRAFRSSADPAPAGADAPAERAAGDCTINGAVFVRALATTCRSSPGEHAATGVDRIGRMAVSGGRSAARTRSTRGAGDDPSPRLASRALVAPASTGRAPAAPSPASPSPAVPVPVIPAPTPVVPPLVPPVEPPHLLDPLLQPAGDGGLVDVDLGLDLSLGL